jgi:hypothetical protein
MTMLRFHRWPISMRKRSNVEIERRRTSLYYDDIWNRTRATHVMVFGAGPTFRDELFQDMSKRRLHCSVAQSRPHKMKRKDSTLHSNKYKDMNIHVMGAPSMWETVDIWPACLHGCHFPSTYLHRMTTVILAHPSVWKLSRQVAIDAKTQHRTTFRSETCVAERNW